MQKKKKKIGMASYKYFTKIVTSLEIIKKVRFDLFLKRRELNKKLIILSIEFQMCGPLKVILILFIP